MNTDSGTGSTSGAVAGSRLWRLLRHRLVDETDARRALGPAALDRITARIAASEQRHSGEIRVCVEAGLPLSYLWRRASARERAVSMFGKLRVWDTEANNGVLIYLLLAEHAIEIVADRGFNSRVEAAEWAAVCEDIDADFRSGRYPEGVVAGVRRVGQIIATHFPQRPGQRDENELPNRPALL